MNLTTNKKRVINAHANIIKCIKLNYKGDKLATASLKGTLIRIFSTETGEKLKELRRGYDNASIRSIDFDYFDNFLTSISKKGSLHVWLLNDSNPNIKKKGTFFKLMQIFEYNSE